MESRIVKMFDFNLVFSTPFTYLEKLAIDYKLTEKESCLCQYLLELSLLDTKFSKIHSHVLAAASIYLMSFLLKKQLKIDY